MALDKTTLKASLKQAFIDEVGTPTTEQSAAFERIATKWADAIDTYVKTAVISVPSGIPVQATAGLSTITGATTATATGSIT